MNIKSDTADFEKDGISLFLLTVWIGSGLISAGLFLGPKFYSGLLAESLNSIAWGMAILGAGAFFTWLARKLRKPLNECKGPFPD